MDIKPEDTIELKRIAKLTAGCIDLDRINLIASILLQDYERAYRMGLEAAKRPKL